MAKAGQSPLTHRRKPSGFTLIELLVVVAIIVVLIAILIPALHQSRELANQVVCRSRLKQLYQAGFVMYALDYNDCLPPFQETDSWWPKWLYPYLRYQNVPRVDNQYTPLLFCTQYPPRWGWVYVMNHRYKINYYDYQCIKLSSPRIRAIENWSNWWSYEIIEISPSDHSRTLYALLWCGLGNWNGVYPEAAVQLHRGYDENFLWLDGHVTQGNPM